MTKDEEIQKLKEQIESTREFVKFFAYVKGSGVQVVGVPQGIRDRARKLLQQHFS